MKKINLFDKTISPLSDGKGCPVERGGVWELPRRTPCATPSWKEGEHSGRGGLWFAALVALFVATPSFATPTELDKKTVASKAYVDTKQDIIETGLVSLGDDWIENLPSVVSFDSTSGLVGNKYGILDLNGSMDYIDDGWQNYVGDPDVEYLIPTVGAVGHELENFLNYLSRLPWSVNINGTPDNGAKQTAAINAYNTTFGNGTNNWAGGSDYLISGQFLANSLALKQNKIPAAEEDYQSVLTDTDEDGVIGKRAILDWQTFDSNFGQEDLYSEPRLANMIPEVKIVGEATRRLDWISATYTPAINAYSTTFGNGTNNWAGNGDHLINGRFLANSLALKQNILAAKTSNARAQAITRSTAGNTSSAYITAGGSVGLTTRSGAPAVINYVNGTVATTEDMTTFTTGTFGSSNTTNQNYIKNALVSLELLKDVYSELNSKITNNALPTGTAGTVVTYNGTNATTGVQEFGERAVYDPANAYNAQNDATKLATMASVKYECAGYEAGHENDPDYCWLWALPN